MVQDRAPATDESALVPGMFAALEPRARRSIWAAATHRRYEAGDVVIEAGGPVDSLYIVGSGLLSGEVPGPSGEPVEIARFAPGTAFGEMAFLEGGPASATVRALTACDLWLVSHETLGRLCEREPAIVRELARMVSARLVRTNLRFRTPATASLGAIVSSGSQRSALAVYRIALSAAHHLNAAVVIVDLTGARDALLSAEKSVAEGVPGVPTTGNAQVSLRQIAPNEVSPSELLHQLDALQQDYRRVIVHLDRAYPEMGLVVEQAGRTIGLLEGDPAGANLPPAGFGTDTVVLGGTPTQLRAHAPAKAGRAPDGTVIATIPEHTDPGDPRTLKAIDWVARHLIQRKVGIAFGAGGAKGYAHIGVLERLADLGVPVDMVAGASIGAPIAVGTAAGRSVPYMKRHLDASFRKALQRRILPVSSLLSNKALVSHLQSVTGPGRLEDLGIPVAIVAVDLAAREEVVFTRGPTAKAILASMAIPGIFPPIRNGGRTLVDGGLLNPVPTEHVRMLGADVVIAVRLTTPAAPPPAPRRFPSPFRMPPVFDTILASFDVMQRKITDESVAGADVTIEPIFAGPVRLLDYSRGDEFVLAGAAGVDAAAAELLELLPWIGK